MVDGALRVSARLVQPADHAVLSAATCNLRLTAEVRELLAASSPVPATPALPAQVLNLKTKADATMLRGFFGRRKGRPAQMKRRYA